MAKERDETEKVKASHGAEQEQQSKQKEVNGKGVESPPETVPIEQVNKLKEQFASVVNAYKEMQKDFDNYRQKNSELRAEMQDVGIVKACETLLPAIDSFKKARKLVLDKSTVDGMFLVETALLNDLEKLGVKKMATVGKEFNPQIHEAVMTVVDPNTQQGCIIDELESGYTFKGKVIRIAKVVVAK